jgi:hypothetical protein
VIDLNRLDAALSGDRHAAPQRPYTVAQAHRVVREHVDCRARRCPAKAAAWDVLVEQGRVVPDPDER